MESSQRPITYAPREFVRPLRREEEAPSRAMNRVWPCSATVGSNKYTARASFPSRIPHLGRLLELELVDPEILDRVREQFYVC